MLLFSHSDFHLMKRALTLLILVYWKLYRDLTDDDLKKKTHKKKKDLAQLYYKPRVNLMKLVNRLLIHVS